LGVGAELSSASDSFHPGCEEIALRTLGGSSIASEGFSRVWCEHFSEAAVPEAMRRPSVALLACSSRQASSKAVIEPQRFLGSVARHDSSEEGLGRVNEPVENHNH